MGRIHSVTARAVIIAAIAILPGCGGGVTIPTTDSGRQASESATFRRDARLPILVDKSPSTAGVFLGEVCGAGSVVSCANFADTFRHGIALGTVYTDWSVDFTKLIKNQGLDAWVQAGVTPEVTWQPTSNVTFTDINRGAYDVLFATSAIELKTWGQTIFLRPFHEFNGNWYPWGLTNQGASSATDRAFVAAWQRMVTIFRAHGASNVKFVWCFSTGGLNNDQKYPWNNPAKAYPGDGYVDWLGFDTYNRGNLAMGQRWRTFDDITQTPYQLATAISNARPIAVSEIASTEYGDGGKLKSSWIRQMLLEL
ncbi:MAG: glycosyl hydrolase, partial [Candidatus Baltobacteraceae bacterium]